MAVDKLLTEGEKELLKLAEDIEYDELEARLLDVGENGVQDDDEYDDLPDLVDAMTEQARTEWADNVMPVRTALLKVSPFIYLIDAPGIECALPGPQDLLQNYKLTHVADG